MDVVDGLVDLSPVLILVTRGHFREAQSGIADHHRGHWSLGVRQTFLVAVSPTPIQSIASAAKS